MTVMEVKNFEALKELSISPGILVYYTNHVTLRKVGIVNKQRKPSGIYVFILQVELTVNAPVRQTLMNIKYTEFFSTTFSFNLSKIPKTTIHKVPLIQKNKYTNRSIKFCSVYFFSHLFLQYLVVSFHQFVTKMRLLNTFFVYIQLNFVSSNSDDQNTMVRSNCCFSTINFTLNSLSNKPLISKTSISRTVELLLWFYNNKSVQIKLRLQTRTQIHPEVSNIYKLGLIIISRKKKNTCTA